MDNSKPRVEVDPSAGFCTGVKRAIDASEKLLNETGDVYCLGEIVHNEAELARLTAKGMKLTDAENIPDISPESRLLIRAHGEPPATFEMLKAKGVKVTDATCPVVLRLQDKVRLASAEMLALGGSVIIYGKPGHPEVVGLLGNASGNAIIVSNLKQLTTIDFTKPIRVFSQTTSDVNGYNEICRDILSRAGEAIKGIPDVVISQTICRQVSRRGPALEEFARLHDVVIFVSGSDSSNGKYLAGVSKIVNPRTFTVSATGQLLQKWFAGAETIGVSGATSTPVWLMQLVAAEIEAMI